MKTALLSILVAALAGAAVILIRQDHELKALRATLAEQTAQVDALERASARKPEPVRVTRARPDETRESAPSVPSPAPILAPRETPPGPMEKKPDMGKLMAGIGNMMTNPAMKEMIRSQSRMQLDMRYDRLFKFLSLSPEETEKVKNLLMDRQMAMMDAGLSFMDKNLSDADRKARGKQMADNKKVFDDQLKALLGDEDYDALTQFEATEPERMQVDMFKHGLTAKGEPLTEQQEYDLVNAMYKARSSSASTLLNHSPDAAPDPDAFTAAGMTRAMEEMKKVEAGYDRSAQSILTPTQYAEFKKFADQQRAMQEMGMKMAAEMFGAGEKK